jgi:hypothetical protein
MSGVRVLAAAAAVVHLGLARLDFNFGLIGIVLCHAPVEMTLVVISPSFAAEPATQTFIHLIISSSLEGVELAVGRLVVGVVEVEGCSRAGEGGDGASERCKEDRAPYD